MSDLDEWDPNCVRDVFAAVQSHAENTREIANDLGRVVEGIPWQGEAHNAALDANKGIRDDMHLHADQIEAVAAAAKTAEAEIRSINADWTFLQLEAMQCGMSIDAKSGTVTYVKSSDPDVAHIQEDNYKTICAEIAKLLEQADQADADLAAAIRGALGKETAGDVAKQVSGREAAEPGEGATKETHGAPGEPEQSGEGSGLTVTKTDLAIAAEGAIAGGTADGVRQSTLKLLEDAPKTGPGAPDEGLLKWLKDPKVGGVELKGFSRLGRVVGAAAAVPAVMSDIGDGNSVAEAVTREGAGVAAGLWAGAASGAAAGAWAGSIVPGAGTAVGLVAGAVVGAGASLLASKGVDLVWDPVADAVGSVTHSVGKVFGFG